LAAILLVAAACSINTNTLPDRPITIHVGPDHPNVLIFITDDQRAEGTLAAMPATRRWFAEQGTSFTRAYATTPLCCPSRASIFTGRYAHNHGVTSNIDISPFDHGATLQRALHDAGYRTAIAGKFLNRWPLAHRPPHFDLFAVFTPGVNARNYYGTAFNHNGDVQQVGGYSTSYIRDRALSFLEAFEEQDQAPWLMVVAPYAPHKPFEVPEEYDTRDVPAWLGVDPETNLRDKPRFLRKATPGTLTSFEEIRTGQFRTLMPVDDMVADIAASLERLEEDSETLAFFLSDNGYSWGEHNMKGKATPYAWSVRIPLLVRWHEESHPAIDRQLAATIDIAPTILRATGLNPAWAGSIDGRALMTPNPHRWLLLEYWKSERVKIPTWGSLVTTTMQYNEYYNETGRVIDKEYYDLRADPRQRRNLLYKARPRTLKDLSRYHRLLVAARRCSGASCP
jgi:arylsulfatase A-like enzyme